MSGTCRKPIQKLSDDMTQIRSDIKDIKRTLVTLTNIKNQQLVIEVLEAKIKTLEDEIEKHNRSGWIFS